MKLFITIVFCLMGCHHHRHHPLHWLFIMPTTLACSQMQPTVPEFHNYSAFIEYQQRLDDYLYELDYW